MTIDKYQNKEVSSKIGKYIKNKKTFKKKCPQDKILNPKTNYCINNNLANRKKIALNKTNVSIKYKTDLKTIHCNKYENLRSLNLNKIELIKDKEKCKKKNEFKISYKEGNQIISLCNIKFLNQGVYGKVYEFSNKNHKVAIKIYKYIDDDEISIIKKLNKMKITCKIINAKLLKNGSDYISVMDLMNGPLSNMNGKLTKPTIIKTIKDIAKHLKCLNDKNLSYTDLKTDNILFKCNNKKYLQTVLGDLGGICKKGKYNICTWNPWEYRNELGYPKCCESTMVWCLGVVFCELIDINIDIFHWSEIPKMDELDIIKYIKKICIYFGLNKIFIDKKKTINMGTLLRDMLNLNPKKRITLNKIIKNIQL